MFEWRNDNRFGIITARLLLFTTIGTALLPFQPASLPPNPQEVSILSYVPGETLQDVAVVYTLQAAVVLSSVVWLTGWLVPLSCWATVVSFVLLAALRLQNSAELCHSYHLLFWLLVIHAAWYTFRKNDAEKLEHVVPRHCDYHGWVLWLSVFTIAWFHTLSGIGKWMTSPDWTSGWNWADGVSLQIWLQACGNPSSRLVRWLIQDQAVAMIAQQALLVIELTAILAIFNATLRRIVGAMLVVYYGFFLHCFVDWSSVAAQVGLVGRPATISSGTEFPLLSYLFQAFWVSWIFLAPDRMLGTWKRPTIG